jgi:hypothetical protein
MNKFLANLTKRIARIDMIDLFIVFSECYLVSVVASSAGKEARVFF